MTATHPPAGTPAARRAAARATAATVRAIVGAGVATMLTVGGAVAAHAEATPSPTPTGLTGVATLTLAPTDNGVVGAGASLSAFLTLDNGTARPLAERTATLSLGDEPITDRAELSSWLSGSGAVADVVEVATATIPAAAAGDAASAVALVEPDAAALRDRAPGVYPLLARTSDSAGSLSSRSVMIVPGTAVAASIGIVVPVTAGPLSAGLLTSDELAELTAADGRLTATLDAVTATPVILAIDPAIPASIRVLGSSAPQTASEWLDRLLRLPNERFALQFGDADVAAQLRAGAAAPMQPSSLESYMDPADFADATPPAVPSPAPTATEPPAGPVLPDLSELLDIGATRAGVYWPISGTADAAVVATLGAAVADGQPSLTVVPATSTDAGGDGGVVSAAQQAAGAALLVYDGAASAALRDAAVLPDIATRGAPLTAATALLSFAAGTPEPTLVVVDRADDYSRAGLRAAIAAVTQIAAPASLLELTDVSAGAVSIADASDDGGRAGAASQLSAEEDALRSFSSILDDPAVLVGPERAEILQLLGASWASEPEQWALAVATHRTASATTLNAVGILPPTELNLISAGAGLGFWVRNDLQWPVNVVLNASPDDLRLEVETTTQVRADAASNKRAEVDVAARRGNGEVTIALQLQSPSGVPIGAAQQADVNVRADWETVGVIILSVLVAGLIVLGLVRTVLHRRWLARRGDAG